MSKCAIGMVLLSFVCGCSGKDFEPSPTPVGSGAVDGGAGASGASGSSGSVGSGAAGQGGAAGSGDAGPVGTGPLGAECVSGEDCESGFCADGVCCNQACDGACESCNADGTSGSCEPYAAGSDPEAECGGNGDPGEVCAGTCNGSSACSFPGHETSCGTGSCSAGIETAKVCGGDGSCSEKSIDCGLFVCGGSSCKTSCAIDADCSADAWCNAGTCEAKQSNGTSCTAKNQCESALCEQGSCCATACASPSACSTGQCLCGGKACGAGASCIVWYLDKDGDGFGAPGPNDTPGCSDTPPAPLAGKSFSKTKTDCYDANAQAFPGQTKFFTQHRGDGSFDYDCNVIISKEVPVSSSVSCKDCGIPGPFGCLNCSVGPSTMGLECMSSWGGCTGVKFKAAFDKEVACGQSGAYRSCDDPCQSIPNGYLRLQGCR